MSIPKRVLRNTSIIKPNNSLPIIIVSINSDRLSLSFHLISHSNNKLLIFFFTALPSISFNIEPYHSILIFDIFQSLNSLFYLVFRITTRNTRENVNIDISHSTSIGVPHIVYCIGIHSSVASVSSRYREIVAVVVKTSELIYISGDIYT